MRNKAGPWTWFCAGLYLAHLIGLQLLILREAPLGGVVIQAAIVGTLQTLMTSVAKRHL